MPQLTAGQKPFMPVGLSMGQGGGKAVAELQRNSSRVCTYDDLHIRMSSCMLGSLEV